MAKKSKQPSQVGQPKPSKYRSRRTEVDGHTFASGREATRYCQLLLMQKAKLIGDLELQPRYRLEVNGVKVCDYVADFRYREGGGVVVEDAKGFRTPEYRIKKKLMLALLGIEVREV